MKPRVEKTQLPTDSQLHARVAGGDFLDCYKVTSTMTAPDAAVIIVDFPGWAQGLVALRNILTVPFGLKKDGPAAKEKLGLFPVEMSSPQEVIAGFNDRHLDFRVSVFSAAGEIYLATWVHPHNIGGRLYLATILPFHILIARNALARVATGAAPDQQAPPLPE
ncbi:DUF2867 domain-containing protein [Roseobacter sp. YSTF-M11]|uniref:DUF2867 domain-containing protein n=1 Tax=Roseobacter insulae TaxID=2859783 RepID=A0A9X1FU10_9RHOB|nr:DUF2867 domain-containing protein [Roseobacter insulae]MBW4707799.1 DUF2867 domain-containing protein [Roseobacter insulae]